MLYRTVGIHCKKHLVVLTIVGLPQLQLSCMLSVGYITRRRRMGAVQIEFVELENETPYLLYTERQQEQQWWTSSEED